MREAEYQEIFSTFIYTIKHSDFYFKRVYSKTIHKYTLFIRFILQDSINIYSIIFPHFLHFPVFCSIIIINAVSPNPTEYSFIWITFDVPKQFSIDRNNVVWIMLLFLILRGTSYKDLTEQHQPFHLLIEVIYCPHKYYTVHQLLNTWCY